MKNMFLVVLICTALSIAMAQTSGTSPSASATARAQTTADPVATATPVTDEWNGYTRHIFQFEGRTCYVVDPKWNATGNPWLWRARFWGHRPEVDLALLAQGY